MIEAIGAIMIMLGIFAAMLDSRNEFAPAVLGIGVLILAVGSCFQI